MKIGSKKLALVGLVAAFALYERWDYVSAHRLQREIRDARAENTSLAAKASQDDDLRRRAEAALAAEESKVGALLSEMTERGKRKDGAAVDSLPETSTGVRAYSSATNVGQGTPLRAFQTAIWATYHGNVDALAKMIALDPRAKAMADQIYSELPAESQTGLQSSDRMIALLIEYAYPSSGTYEVSWSGPMTGDSNEWLLATKIVAESGQTTAGQLTFRQVDGTWMLSVPQAVVKQLGGVITGVPVDSNQKGETK